MELKRLLERLRYWREERRESWGGMGPVSWLEERERFVRDLRREMEGGRVPVRLWLEMLTAVTWWWVLQVTPAHDVQGLVEVVQEEKKDWGSEVMEDFRDRRAWTSEMGGGFEAAE